MPVEISWPNGSTASFDGETWTSDPNAPTTGAVLGLMPRDVSVMVNGWEYVHALDVAAAFGAEVVGDPPDIVIVPDVMFDGEPAEEVDEIGGVEVPHGSSPEEWWAFIAKMDELGIDEDEWADYVPDDLPVQVDVSTLSDESVARLFDGLCISLGDRGKYPDGRYPNEEAAESDREPAAKKERAPLVVSEAQQTTRIRNERAGFGRLSGYGEFVDRSTLPEEVVARLKTIGVPPGWTDVNLSEDPNQDMQVLGTDAKGRRQYRYSAAHSEKAAAEKFQRLTEFNKELPRLRSRVAKDVTDASLSLRDKASAEVVYLIDKTAFRIGSDAETVADEQAFGASTLRAEHVKIDGDTVSFSFVGKSGVKNEKVVKDATLAKLLTPRVAQGGRLFETSDQAVRDYLHSRDGEFMVKDFRTHAGTTTALKAMKSVKPPSDEKELSVAKLEVAKAVAAHLGNTPAVALENYIDPSVWTVWKVKAKKAKP